jgi:hypothetical protein
MPGWGALFGHPTPSTGLGEISSSPRCTTTRALDSPSFQVSDNGSGPLLVDRTERPSGRDAQPHRLVERVLAVVHQDTDALLPSLWTTRDGIGGEE